LQLGAGGAAGGLNRDPVNDGGDEAGQRCGIRAARQIALALGALESLAKLGDARFAARRELIADALGGLSAAKCALHHQASARMTRVARGEIKLLYVAPERFDAGRTAERLKKAGVSLLAIDEAHCISQWGHDFRPSYLRVKKVHAALGSPTTIALTATATPEVRRDIGRELALRDPQTIITGFDRPNLTYRVLPRRDLLTEVTTIIERHRGESVFGPG